MSDLYPVHTEDIPLVTRRQSMSRDLEAGTGSIQDDRPEEVALPLYKDKLSSVPTSVAVVVAPMHPKQGFNNSNQMPSVVIAGRKIQLTTTFLIPIWIILSTSLIIYNDYIFHTLRFEFPVFLVTFHLLFATIGTRVLARTTQLIHMMEISDIGPIGWTLLFYIAILFLLSTTFSNFTFAHLSARYTQRLKALNPIMVFLCYWAFKKSSRRLFLIVLTISFGVCMAGYDELDGVDFLLQGFTVVTESIRLLLIKYLLHVMKIGPTTLLHYSSPMGLILYITSLGTEGLASFRLVIPQVGFGHLFANALTAFMLNITSLWLIHINSALVLTLAGVFKDLLTIAVCMVASGRQFSVVQIIGYLLAISGLITFRAIGNKI